jgi:hypothetical protein
MVLPKERKVLVMMKVELVMRCPMCDVEHSVEVGIRELENYENGALAQRAFPKLSITEREQIISHLCPECQKKIFGE